MSLCNAYGDIGFKSCDSAVGTAALPYTELDDENTTRVTLNVFAATSRLCVPVTLES